MIWSGWFICTLALIAASFSKTVWQLILTQGLLYGIGFLILYYAMLSMLNEWFVERRGLAYGILFAAAGLSGTGLPFLAEACLRRFGYAATLRGFAVTLVVCVGPMLPFCRGRLTPQEDVQATTVSFRKVLTNPLFYFFSISNLFQGLGFYLPSLYVGIFSDSLKVSSSKGVIVICLLNLSQVLSQIAIGWLSDCTNIFALLLLSSIGSAIFGCVLWYVASGFGHLVAFALTYGLFAGGYTVLYTRFCSACADDPPTTLWLYGIFAFERGIGNVVAGPISAALLHRFQRQLNSTHSSYAYRELGLFVGACMLASALGAFGYFWRGYALGPGRIAVQGLVRRKTNWKSGERPKIALQRPKSVVHYREDYNFDEGRPF
jgi:MFS family permease